MSKMARNKGKRGERMVIDWLQPILDEITARRGVKPVLLQRNTIQSDRGGSDIVGLNWLAAEVKNCESQGTANLNKWWEQCVEQAQQWSTAHRTLTPVLFYTKNHAPIRVRMMGAVWCVTSPLCYHTSLVDISAEDFECYFRARIEHELGREHL